MKVEAIHGKVMDEAQRLGEAVEAKLTSNIDSEQELHDLITAMHDNQQSIDKSITEQDIRNYCLWRIATQATLTSEQRRDFIKILDERIEPLKKKKASAFLNAPAPYHFLLMNKIMDIAKSKEPPVDLCNHKAKRTRDKASKGIKASGWDKIFDLLDFVGADASERGDVLAMIANNDLHGYHDDPLPFSCSFFRDETVGDRGATYVFHGFSEHESTDRKSHSPDYGYGSTGKVKRGILADGSEVAIKTLFMKQEEAEKYVHRATRYDSAMSEKDQLKEQVKLYGAIDRSTEDHQGGKVLLVMELAGDYELGQLPQHTTAAQVTSHLNLVAASLLKNMEYYYDHKILNRDMKPQNTMVDSVTLLAKIIDATMQVELTPLYPPTATQEDLERGIEDCIQGTVLYMPPQFFHNPSKCVFSYATDMYSTAIGFMETAFYACCVKDLEERYVQAAIERAQLEGMPEDEAKEAAIQKAHEIADKAFQYNNGGHPEYEPEFNELAKSNYFRKGIDYIYTLSVYNEGVMAGTYRAGQEEKYLKVIVATFEECGLDPALQQIYTDMLRQRQPNPVAYMDKVRDKDEYRPLLDATRQALETEMAVKAHRGQSDKKAKVKRNKRPLKQRSPDLETSRYHEQVRPEPDPVEPSSNVVVLDWSEIQSLRQLDPARTDTLGPGIFSKLSTAERRMNRFYDILDRFAAQHQGKELCLDMRVLVMAIASTNNTVPIRQEHLANLKAELALDLLQLVDYAKYREINSIKLELSPSDDIRGFLKLEEGANVKYALEQACYEAQDSIKEKPGVNMFVPPLPPRDRPGARH